MIPGSYDQRAGQPFQIEDYKEATHLVPAVRQKQNQIKERQKKKKNQRKPSK